jgi:hypothetical protein
VSVANGQAHHVQLFDSPSSRAEAVFTFVRDGLIAGDAILLVVTVAHWDAILRRSRDEGLDLDAARATGRLTVRDAFETLDQFTTAGLPVWSAFDRTVGALVRRLASNGSRLRIYGEMVDVLARQGEFDAAHRLEEFWNRLQEQSSWMLFCGYSAEHFGNPRDGDALRRICELHSHVHSDPRDVLGNFLLKTHAAC